MPIFRYTLNKIFVSISTWIIFGISVIMLGGLWALSCSLSYQSFSSYSFTIFLQGWKNISFSIFIALLFLIFIGIKATQIFRDEIDDGTLLILVSKPISRNRIWIEKWLSFQVSIIFYTFFTIFFAGLILAIAGSWDIYRQTLPYMGMLFGIILIFDLIFSSIVLLLTLVMSSKATVAITITFAALLMFSPLLFGFVLKINIPEEYFQISQAVGVLHDVEKNATKDDINWLLEQKPNEKYDNDIEGIIKKVYENIIKTDYDPIAEQKWFNEIKNNPQEFKDRLSDWDIALVTHIVNISNSFRESKNNSYASLMGVNLNKDEFLVKYNVFNLIKGLNQEISQKQLDDFNKAILKKKIFSYINIFHQLTYLWNGSLGDNKTLYISEQWYQTLDDPYLVSFNKKDDGQYQVNINSGKTKILNFPALLTVYLLLGMSLLGTSWYIFNRKDFA